MSPRKTPGHPGPDEATDDDVIERLQTCAVFLVATSAMVGIRFSDPQLNPGVSLGFGLMVLIIGAIDILGFQKINRFNRHLAREGRYDP